MKNYRKLLHKNWINLNGGRSNNAALISWNKYAEVAGKFGS